jgi:hypothetical protein
MTPDDEGYPSLLVHRLLDKHRERMREVSEQFTQLFARAASQLATAVQTRQREFVDQITRSMKPHTERLAAQTRQTVLDLANRGWYLDPKLSMRQTMHVLDVYSRGAHRKAEQLLVRYYDKHLTEIQNEVCRTTPNRATIIRAAFWAHRRKKFVLSTPVMLIQADGMCLDALNAQLFQRRRGRPATAEALGPLAGAMESFLAPLMEPIPVTASHTERKTLAPGELNRHAIIHGEALRYGTRVNSCKAVSLLRYLAWLLPRPENRQKAG